MDRLISKVSPKADEIERDIDEESNSEEDEDNSEEEEIGESPAVQKLTEEQRAELKEAFAVFDIDGDAQIEANELKVVLEAIGRKVTMETVQEMIQKVDNDGTGQINYSEFL